jgi:hypothetical protein
MKAWEVLVMKSKNKLYIYAGILLAVSILAGVFLVNGQALKLPENLTGYAGGLQTARDQGQPSLQGGPSVSQSNYSCTVEVYTDTKEKLEKGNMAVRTPDYTLKLYTRNNLVRLDLPYLGDSGTRIYANTADSSVILYSNYTKSTYTDASLGADSFIPPGADKGKELGRESITQGKDKINCIVKSYQNTYGTSKVFFNEATLLPVKVVFEGGQDNPPVEIFYTGYQMGKVSASTVTCPN